VAERIWGRGRDRLPGTLRWLLTFLFVNVAWVFFRAPSLSAACTMLSSAVFGGWRRPDEALVTGLLDTEVTLLTGLLPALRGPLPWLGLAALLGLGLWVSLRREHTVRAMETFRPALWRALLCAVLLVWSILSFSARGTFIYSNF
jgi:alginate O-acetyltransferase complex protein AlgI